jgi:hypothetical protein
MVNAVIRVSRPRREVKSPQRSSFLVRTPNHCPIMFSRDALGGVGDGDPGMGDEPGAGGVAGADQDGAGRRVQVDATDLPGADPEPGVISAAQPAADLARTAFPDLQEVTICWRGSYAEYQQ